MAEKKEVTTVNKAELVIIIFNVGFEQQVSDIAKELKIGGGTFINAHGLSKFEAEKFFGMAIESEKSVCLLVVNAKKRNDVLKTFYEKCGIATEAQGIIFSVPVQGLSENLKGQLFEEKHYVEPEVKVTDHIEEENKEEEKEIPQED